MDDLAGIIKRLLFDADEMLYVAELVAAAGCSRYEARKALDTGVSAGWLVRHPGGAYTRRHFNDRR